MNDARSKQSCKLFVYGTLAPGRPNEHVLAPLNGEWQPGFIRGVLHEQGWGAALGYPAIALDEQAEEVPGQLFSSEALSDFWARLDAFEGDAYQRTIARVRLDDDSFVDAFVYALKLDN